MAGQLTQLLGVGATSPGQPRDLVWFISPHHRPAARRIGEDCPTCPHATGLEPSVGIRYLRAPWSTKR